MFFYCLLLFDIVKTHSVTLYLHPHEASPVEACLVDRGIASVIIYYLFTLIYYLKNEQDLPLPP